MSTPGESGLEEFAETARLYYEVSAKRHGNAWLCSLRSKMRLGREEFELLALEAHRAGLIELARADLTHCDDPRYLEESELAIPGSRYSFHFMRRPGGDW